MAQSYALRVSTKTRILNKFRKLLRNDFCERFLIDRNVKKNGKSIFSRFIPPEYLYDRPSFREYHRNGRRFNLDISNGIDHYAFFNFGEMELENLYKKIQEHFCIVDIGANIGITVVNFANLASNGRVICFEPSVKNFERLTENIALNNLSNVVAVNKGIGAHPGEYDLYNVVETNSGMKRILPNAKAGDQFEFETIVIGTLDEELKKQKIEKVDLIKVDVEGFEFEVLKSARKIMEKDKPLLFVELDDNNLRDNDASAAEMVEYLKTANYLISFANNLEALPDSYDFTNCHFDIICEQI